MSGCLTSRLRALNSQSDYGTTPLTRAHAGSVTCAYTSSYSSSRQPNNNRELFTVQFEVYVCQWCHALCVRRLLDIAVTLLRGASLPYSMSTELLRKRVVCMRNLQKKFAAQ